MTDNGKDEKGGTPVKTGGGTLSLKGLAGAKARQSLSPGGRGTVVEVRRSRTGRSGNEGDTGAFTDPHHLTSDERDARAKALQHALSQPANRSPSDKKEDSAPSTGGVTRTSDGMRASDARQRELEELQRIEQEEKRRAGEAAGAAPGAPGLPPRPGVLVRRDVGEDEESASSYRDRVKKAAPRAPKTPDVSRRPGRLTVAQVLNENYERDRNQSLAAQRRAREKARKASGGKESIQKVYREVVVPETITVQELANRMTERSGNIIKSLMKMGVMATINHVLDADTAELIVLEFGHTIRRVTEADVEGGLNEAEEIAENLIHRAPVVTIMGHVDHGKTSLLDALRATDVVAGEAGGITQHIGAYQVTLASGAQITFLDTPGHAAFTEMRARGANATDIVVLVVSATDSVMPQTIEAINHAKAAKVPIIVAINKIDLPDANPQKIRQDLLQYELVPEELGGDIQCIEISAKKKMNLDKLEEAILLQAEILELKANPNRPAQGVVVEARMETGRGSIATVLVQQGTLRTGDIFAVGGEWGRARVLLDDKGVQISEAGPGKPVEVLGLQGTPSSGDSFNVVENESRAREISLYRQRQKKEKTTKTVIRAGQTLDELLAAAKETEDRKNLSLVIKGDVHGSVEAIIGSLMKMTEENTEIGVQVLHSGVGGITESDITLARASKALVIGFNVRANAQAREQAQRDGVDIRYYNIIYNVIDDAKTILSGMLSPAKREEYLGQAEVRQVFNITKVGKIGGCLVTIGSVKRGAGVRLLRDNVVIHEGTLKTLKRFKDEVKEVKEGTECGMAFENYEDLKEGDIIECFEIVEEARTLA